jgi:hypothetical protein
VDFKKEIDQLYDDFIHHRLKYHYTSYFPRLRVFYEQGEGIVRYHALELILNIILGGKWAQEGGSERSRIVNLVQHRIEQIINGSRKEVSPQEISIDRILNWLENTLPFEKDENIKRIFYIFINTHWEHLEEEKNETYTRLRELHLRMMEDVKYSKNRALDRLNREYFSDRYQPIN